MAIIYSYPKVTTPLATDVLVLTDTTIRAGKRKNQTKSLALSDLASYVVSSTSAITGSGTINTIPMFTPSGVEIGDSLLRQDANSIVYVGPDDSVRFTGTTINTPTLLATNVFTTNITSSQTGVVTIRGNAIIGDAATDVLQISSSVSDYTGTASTAAGEILVSTANGQLVWAPAPSSGSVTGTGTTNTLPIWTDGPNGDIGDSQLRQLGPNGSGLYQLRLENADRFIINKPSSVISGDPAFQVAQDGDPKVEFGWDDDGGGYGFLYNYAGLGWRFGAIGNNPELEITTTAGSEGVTITNNLIINGSTTTAGLSISTASGSDFLIKSSLTDETLIALRPDSGVSLYYNNDKKSETTSYGFRVGGDLRVTGFLDLFQGDDNTFAGSNAGNLDNIIGSTNTGFGENTQAVQSTGQSNASLGFDSLKSSVTGNNNTAIGTNSLSLSNGGSFNTALGSGSLSDATLGQGNTAIGYNALENKTTTNFNTAVGNNSLGNITSGFRNTAVGNNAGKFILDGTTANATAKNSVFIGDEAKAEADGQTNQIVIGQGAIGNGANTATIGNTATTVLHVGGDNTGIVLKSPNGTAYTIRVTDAGALVVT